MKNLLFSLSRWTLVDRNVEKPLEGENFQFNNGEVLVNLDDNTLIGGNLIRCKDANQVNLRLGPILLMRSTCLSNL